MPWKVTTHRLRDGSPLGFERETQGRVRYPAGIEANVFLPDLPDGNDLVPKSRHLADEAVPATNNSPLSTAPRKQDDWQGCVLTGDE